MVSLGAWTIMTPRLRAALTTWFIRGAMAATRWADRLHVCASHISQMTMAVCATSQRSTFSDTRFLFAPCACSPRRRTRRLSAPGTRGRLGRPASCACDVRTIATDAMPRNVLLRMLLLRPRILTLKAQGFTFPFAPQQQRQDYAGANVV